MLFLGVASRIIDLIVELTNIAACDSCLRMHHAPNLITDPRTAPQILASLLQNSGEQRPISLFFRSPNRRRPSVVLLRERCSPPQRHRFRVVSWANVGGRFRRKIGTGNGPAPDTVSRRYSPPVHGAEGTRRGEAASRGTRGAYGGAEGTAIGPRNVPGSDPVYW